jgi:hypothetical protein
MSIHGWASSTANDDPAWQRIGDQLAAVGLNPHMLRRELTELHLTALDVGIMCRARRVDVQRVASVAAALVCEAIQRGWADVPDPMEGAE